jgi:type IV fimbrial biogenesis protein FimT
MPAWIKGDSDVPSEKPRRWGTGGFTLIELLVTLSIAAILATIAFPSFLSTIQRNRMSTTAGALQADLAYARSEAVRRGSSVSLCPATVSDGTAASACNNASDWSTGWIIFVDPNANGAVDSGETILRQRVPEKGMTLSPVSGSVMTATSIRALPVGEYSQNGVIRVCKSTYQGIDVTLQRSGNVRAQTSTAVCS